MKKYIPIEKRQKKEQKELAKARRGTWFGVKPTTRIVENSKKKKLEKAKINDSFDD